MVVISACFSGVFIPPLQKSDRLVLTAARPDRASFGCGEDDKYPYFDDCFLSTLPDAHDFRGPGRGGPGLRGAQGEGDRRRAGLRTAGVGSARRCVPCFPSTRSIGARLPRLER
ncbi:C13 family peptidase [Caulobacter segnis]